MFQPALDDLAALWIQHGNLLEARMKITAYNQHARLLPPSLGRLLPRPSLLGRGSRRTHPISKGLNPGGCAGECLGNAKQC